MGWVNLFRNARGDAGRRAGEGRTSGELRGAPPVAPARRPAQHEATVHVLGGRRFISITESTIEHDLYFHALAGRAGLRFEKRAGESPADFAARILDETIQTGKALELIGCLMVPEEIGAEGWTSGEARKTAAFIGQLRGEEDKARVRALILTLLMDFFRCGLASIWTFPSSSRSQPANDPSELRTATAAGAVS